MRSPIYEYLEKRGRSAIRPALFGDGGTEKFPVFTDPPEPAFYQKVHDKISALTNTQKVLIGAGVMALYKVTPFLVKVFGILFTSYVALPIERQLPIAFLVLSVWTLLESPVSKPWDCNSRLKVGGVVIPVGPLSLGALVIESIQKFVRWFNSIEI